MSVQAITWAYQQDLPCAHKFVLVTLADNWGGLGEVPLKTNHFSQICGVTVQGFENIVSDLVGRGYMNIQPGHRYSLNVPSPEIEQKARPALGAVYLLKIGYLHKIGISQNVMDRLKNIQSTNACDVSLVQCWNMDMDIARKVERAAHNRLRAHRVRGALFDVGKMTAVAAVDTSIEERG